LSSAPLLTLEKNHKICLCIHEYVGEKELKTPYVRSNTMCVRYSFGTHVGLKKTSGHAKKKKTRDLFTLDFTGYCIHPI